MKPLLLRLLALVLLVYAAPVVRAEHVPDPADPLGSGLRFIRNNGQWADPIQYLVRMRGGDLYFESNRLVWHGYTVPDRHAEHDKHFGPGEDLIRGHIYTLSFVGASPRPVMKATHAASEYHNYYHGQDPSRWASHVPLYGLLTYENMYPGIDLRYYGVAEGVKYDWIVAPGADPAQIKLELDGVDQLSLDKGSLLIQTSVREIRELPPVVYQLIGGQRVEVPCRFRLTGHTVTYDFPKGYDRNHTLIIDPTLVFSTYSGSQANNWGFTATYDSSGNAYAGGIQYGFTPGLNYPVTTGAYQTVFQGGLTDVTISKFSPDGTALLFSTYLGGVNDDQPHSMIVDAQQDLIIFGRTNSGDFPVTNGAYDVSLNGQFDIFVSKLAPDGTAMVASTFVGGSQNDGVNGTVDLSTFSNTEYNYGDDARGEVMLDAAGNILVAACTRSFNFPTVNAFQPGIGGGQDGCIFRLSPGLNTLQFASYIGGSGEDAAYAVKVDSSGFIFVAGGTTSTGYPATGGVYTSYRGGVADGFVLRILSSGNAVTHSTFVGTNQYDQVYLLELDKYNNVYVVGQTKGTYQVVNPIAGPVYSNPGSKQFITKFNNTLTQIVFSTIFGSSNSNTPNISPTALLVDRCENIYVTGWGGDVNQEGNTNNMPVTPDAFDPTSQDGSDFYMIVLARDAQSIIYGSYIGGNGGAGDHVDGGTSRFDKNGVIYHAVCAGCWANSSFPSTPGVWSPTNGSTGCNLALFKMAFDLAGVEAAFEPLDQNNQPIATTEGCAPFLVNFDNNSFLGGNPGVVQYFWDFDDNGASATTFQPSYTYQNPGVYEVMLIITDSTSCNIADTTYRTIVVNAPPEIDAGPDITTCQGDTVQLAVTAPPGSTFLWTPPNTFITATTISNPQVVVPAGLSTYFVTVVDANLCEARDTVSVFANTTFPIAARSDTVICLGGSVSLGVNAPGAVSYQWTSVPAANISNPNIPNPVITNLDTTTVFYIESFNALGCRALDSVRVSVFEVFLLEDTSVCRGSSVLLNAQNGVSFSWTPIDGSLNDPGIANPAATPLQTTTYTVTAISVGGCISVKDVTVTVLPLPVAVAGPDFAICLGQTLQLNGSGGLQYRWSPTLGLSNPLVANPFATPGQTTTYTLTVTDINGCQSADSMVLTVRPLPAVSAGADVTICAGESLELRASGAAGYLWTPVAQLSDPFIANPVATPIATTRYVVTGTDLNGCQNRDTVVVTVIERPVTDITGVNKTCIGGQIELTASGGQTYIWSTGQTTPVIEVNPVVTTTYYATAYVGNCEGSPDSITVDAAFDFPEASFTFSPDSGYAPIEITFTNTSTNANAYVWDFGFGLGSRLENPVHIYPAAGEWPIRLIAYSASGCPDTAVSSIVIRNVTLHVPSGFTPNADEHNPYFRVGYIGILTLQVRIYNRWGEKIFESDNPDFTWDGTYQGRPVQEGVYVYVITGTAANGVPYERNGTVTVIR
ncbi:MAG: PKD domain-containing protein [Bacteroidia bacterium]|nr:PKD domain-containing protein [Bacteroidia bacterium]